MRIWRLERQTTIQLSHSHITNNVWKGGEECVGEKDMLDDIDIRIIILFNCVSGKRDGDKLSSFTIR